MYSGDADALGLLVLALLLAWPVPLLLAGARWTLRAPRAALVLWQAIGLAGGLAAIGALLACGLAPLAAHLGGGIDAALRHGVSALPWWRLAALAAGAALACWLLAVLAASFWQVGRDRRAHRVRLDLVGRAAHGLGEIPEGPRTVLVLDHPVAVAYCVPGVRPRVVLSSAVLDLLDGAELDAVLAHEHAHARHRHDLVVQPFVAWQRTFPWLAPARQAMHTVALLVELLADDAAAREVGPRVVAGAITRLGMARQGTERADLTRELAVLSAAADTASGTLLVRVRRLLEPAEPSAPRQLPWLAYPIAVLLVATPTLLLLRP